MTTPTSTLDKFDTDMTDDVENFENQNEQAQHEEEEEEEEEKDLEKGIIGALDSPKVKKEKKKGFNYIWQQNNNIKNSID